MVAPNVENLVNFRRSVGVRDIPMGEQSAIGVVLGAGEALGVIKRPEPRHRLRLCFVGFDGGPQYVQSALKFPAGVRAAVFDTEKGRHADV